jgi:hypothetical protein
MNAPRDEVCRVYGDVYKEIEFFIEAVWLLFVVK